MNIHNSENPAKEAGEHISKSIKECGADVVCLLAGGSALDVVKYIELPAISECRTIFMMGDERVSRERDLNNYMQLQSMYPDYRILEHTIETIPLEGESVEIFAERIGVEFLQKITELNEPHIISLQGIGDDGHTAGIFPMDRDSFTDSYKDTAMYVPVHVNSLEANFRTTFTPNWLLENVDEMIGFVAGEKKAAVTSMLTSEQKSLHERPAELLKQHHNAFLYTDQLG